MRSIFFAAGALAISAVMPAMADEAKQDFTLVNRTGYELKEIYVSPGHADDWQEDVLGRQTLGDGERLNVHFHAKTRTCTWDLKVVYTDDDSSAIWHDINLCQVEKVTIHYDRKKDVTRATFD
jgi:hypothetical protein